MKLSGSGCFLSTTRQGHLAPTRRARETSRESSSPALYTGCEKGPCQGANAAFATRSQKPVSAWELIDLAGTGDKSILQLHHDSSYNEIMVQGVKPR
jgi:hypothetical protein